MTHNTHNTDMNTTTTTEAYGLKYWIAQTLQTRRYGHTYVHSGARSEGAPNHGNISFSFRSWGRSLQSGGHKFKVHSTFIDTHKPVPSKVLRTLL